MNRENKNTQRFTTRICEMYISNNILYIVLFNSISVEECDVEEMVPIAQKLCGDRKYLIYIDTGINSKFSSGCRRYYAKHFARWRKAEAIISRSFYHKLAAQLYISVDKPEGLVRIFRTPAGAIEWLRKKELDFAI